MNIIKPGRGVGNTTRAIDAAIQEFFNTGNVTYIDPSPTENAQRFGFERLLNRLNFEHRLTEDYLIIDRVAGVVKKK